MAVSGAWTYTESGGNATITDYDTGVGGFTPTIPTTLDTFPVIAIADGAMESKSLTSVTIGHAVNLIGDAIANNGTLTVTINATVTTSSVSTTAAPFRSCTIGGNLTLISSMTSIPNYLLYSCGLSSITIPTSCTSVGIYAVGANSLTSLTIPTALVTIGAYAFTNNSIASLTLDHVMDIDDNAFAYNSGMSVTLSANVTCNGIGSTADPPFEGCALAGNVTVSDGVTTIPKYLFYNCGLSTIDFPTSVTSLELYCIGGNNTLDTVIIRAAETVTFGSFVLTNSQPSPKGTIYGYDSSVETWAAGFSTYYDFSYDVPGSSAYITNFSSVMYNSSKFSKVIDFLA